MGRVKAGKSTLLNGLVGQTVAGTHAFELTTAIHEVAVRSGPRGPRALLRRADQPDAEMSPLELAELIQANRDAPDFWSSVEHLQTWVEVLEIPDGRDGRVDVAQALAALSGRGVRSLLVEGGATLAGAFADAGLVDRVYACGAPLLIGGDAARPAVGGRGAERLEDALQLVDLRVERVGEDVLLVGDVQR